MVLVLNTRLGLGLEIKVFVLVLKKKSWLHITGFNLQMPDAKLQPTKIDKSSEPCERHKSQFIFKYHLY